MPVDYHAWTHRPKSAGGTDPLDFPQPWIALTNGATTIADGTWVNVPFNDAYWDPALTTPGNSADDGPFQLVEILIDGTEHYQLKTWIEGWYYYNARVLFDQVTTPGQDLGAAYTRIDMSGSMFFQNDDDLRASADWNATDYVTGEFEMLHNPWIRDSGRIFVPSGRTWGYQARQDTGLSRGLTGDILMVWFLGADESDNWATSTAGV